MKLSKSLLSVLVASTIVMSGTSAFAVTSTENLQAASLVQMKQQTDILALDMKAYQDMGIVLASAKRSGAGFQTALSTSGTVTTAGTALAGLSGAARIYQQFAKASSPFVRNGGKGFVQVILKWSAIAAAAGAAASVGSSIFLDLSAADVEAAKLALAQKEQEMAMRRQMIAGIAAKAGATVTQNIETKEIVVSGLDGLQNIYGSGVLTLPMPMPVAVPAAR
ncbi:MAG: hypothetical protein JNM24_07780 [Bdellovibrionaceae bacterium]|nr:hypothetical protein [Pseudobdellovibrionaceae bacterium]